MNWRSPRECVEESPALPDIGSPLPTSSSGMSGSPNVQGKSADEIATEYDLTLADVYAWARLGRLLFR